MRLFELVPRPCGHTHAHLREILDCVEANGVPGYELREAVSPHEHDWSNPVDELGGKVACRGCGHIGDRTEQARAFFQRKAEERRAARRARHRRRRQ